VVAVGVELGMAVAVAVGGSGVLVMGAVLAMVNSPSTGVTASAVAAAFTRIAWVMGNRLLPVAAGVVVKVTFRIAPAPGAIVRLFKL
jgi:hypothetical protein